MPHRQAVSHSTTIHERISFACPRCGGRSTAIVAAVVDCRGGPDAPVNSGAQKLQCSVCGHETVIDVATLLYRGDDVLAVIFIPGEYSSLEADGREGARLVRLLDAKLGRAALGPSRRLVVAPRHLAALVARRPVVDDALKPPLIAIDSAEPAMLAEYQRWLRAIRQDLELDRIRSAIADIVSAPTWQLAADIVRRVPLLCDEGAAHLVEHVFDQIALTDTTDAVALGRCRRYVREVCASGRDPFDVPIPDLGPPLTGATPAIQEAVTAAINAPKRAIDDRIVHLRRARDASVRAYGADGVETRVVISQSFAGELYRRSEPRDIEEAIQVLQSVVPHSAAALGPSAPGHLKVLNDLAVLYLDRPIGDGRLNRGLAEALLHEVEASIDPGDEGLRQVLVDVWLNLGVARLEAHDAGDRSEPQEEGIAWLEQALEARPLSPAMEARLCSNLGAAYRSRAAGDRRDNLARARRLHDRGVTLSRESHRSELDERLIGALAMAGTSASDIGDHDAAVEAFREAIGLASGMLPATHPTVLRMMANLGSALHDRFLARRAEDRPDALADVHEAQQHLQSTCAAMANTRPPHPMLQTVRANLAAVLAEHLGPGRLDGEAAAALFDDLVQTTDPDVDPAIVRSVGWNAGTFHLVEGDTPKAIRYYRAGWQAAKILSDRALLFASKSNELRVMSGHAHRLALSICLASSGEEALSEAFEVLDSSRTRLIGGISERVRLTLTEPALSDEVSRQAIFRARDALDRQLLGERDLPQASPQRRRQLAKRTRGEIDAALSLISPFMSDHIVLEGRLAEPVVHVATCDLGTAVVIRFPDGGLAGFAANVRSEHVAALQRADSSTGGHVRRIGDALVELLPVLGVEVAEPLAAHLLGRGYRSAVVIPGGVAAYLPFHAAPVRGGPMVQGGHLTDVLSLRTAPSYRLLRPASTERGQPAGFLGVVDEQLAGARWELRGGTQFLVRAADNETMLVHPTKADLLSRLRCASWVHISVHAAQSDEDPLLAQLEVPGAPLSLVELLTEHRFTPGATVVAPACQAGRVDPTNLDESLSVAHGLIAAGADTVISALWHIPDLSSAIVIARFYALLDQHRLWGQPELALRSAQRWLRDATCEQLLAEASEAQTNGSSWLAPELGAELEWWINAHRDDRPFHNPVHWAGLVVLSTRVEPIEH